MVTYSISSIILITLLFILRRRNIKYKYAFIFTTLITLVAYSVWKVNVILKSALPIKLDIVLVLIDVFLILKILIMVFLYIFEKKSKHNIKIDTSNNYEPSVDLFIYIDYEPIDILRKAIIASKNLEYNSKKLNIYICNSKERSDVKYLADIYEINSFEFNSYNKPEALNNVISKTVGDIIVVLDTCRIPKKNFLKETTKYFYNKDITYVQVLKEYSKNQYGIQSLFKKMNIREIYNEEFTNAFIGMLYNSINTVFRRSAIEKLGGFSKEYISPDIVMGLSMEMEGYKGVCVLKPIVISINLIKAKLFIKKIEIMTAGIVQIMKSMKVYSNKKLGIYRKLNYTYIILLWFEVINRTLIIIGFLMYTYMTKEIFRVPIFEVLCYVIPTLLLSIIYCRCFIYKSVRYVYKRYFNITTYPYILKALIFSLFSNKYICRKKEESEVYIVSERDTNVITANPYLILLIISLISLLHFGSLKSTLSIGLRSIIIIIFTVLYLINLNNHIKLINCAKKENEDNKISIDEEILLTLTCNNKTMISKIISVSDKEISLELDTDIEIDKYTSGEINIDGQVMCGVVINRCGNIVEMRFGNLTREEYEVLLSIYLNNMKVLN